MSGGVVGGVAPVRGRRRGAGTGGVAPVRGPPALGRGCHYATLRLISKDAAG